MKMILIHSDINSPHIPMWNMDNTNNSMVLMIEPYRVPSIACFAWFMACIDVVRGPCT